MARNTVSWSAFGAEFVMDGPNFKIYVTYKCTTRGSHYTAKLGDAMRSGMMSGWAASRAGKLSDTASLVTFGGYQGGHRTRWSIPRPQVVLR